MDDYCPSPTFNIGDDVIFFSFYKLKNLKGKIISRKIQVGWFYSGYIYLVESGKIIYKVKQDDLWKLMRE